MKKRKRVEFKTRKGKKVSFLAKREKSCSKDKEQMIIDAFKKSISKLDI